jgi:hypothetical protein
MGSDRYRHANSFRNPFRTRMPGNLPFEDGFFDAVEMTREQRHH